MRNRTVIFLGIMALAAAVAGLIGLADPGAGGETIAIICPWGVGSVGDGMLCALKPLLEEKLDADVEIRYVEGEGGLRGVRYASEMPADGKHFIFITQSMVINDLKGKIEFPFREAFEPVARLTDAVYILSTSFDTACSLFGSYRDMLAYARSHPGGIACGALSLSGIDGLAMEKLFPDGIVTPVEYDSGKALTQAVLEGEVQMQICCAGEIMGLIERNDLIPLVVLSDERLAMLPDVPCTGELGLNAAVGTWSGLCAPAGTEKEKIERICSALSEIAEDPGWIRYLTMSSYNGRGAFLDTAGFERFLENEYGRYTAFLQQRGLLKRFYGEMD
ncbi:MAG: tripartite tricarboxylate transporter substrate-binding protein [Clostridia bacterium]|nr:tripartite tricarboxylate transporter substrate-binding protein [Clostridia bacterium]